ncbi:hypothetical protein AQUCO_10900023v1 [Aquilegia coerulea]|uniref:ATP synthase subunit e, mitochondrial n=1 Tax=Aquilegia coerulea TaxID=218851 RepID=A0A2G5C336_AQUCA|nr:hypothetical protein AQUCO_10900023v1 [Aquilegia coerulea]
MGFAYFNFTTNFLNRMKSPQKVEQMAKVGLHTAIFALVLSIRHHQLKPIREETRLVAEENRKKREEAERKFSENKGLM